MHEAEGEKVLQGAREHAREESQCAREHARLERYEQGRV